jgi:hypothetical protein
MSIIFVDVGYRFFFSIICNDFGFDVDSFYNRDFDSFFAEPDLRFRGPRSGVVTKPPISRLSIFCGVVVN